MASPIRKASFVGGEWSPSLHARVDLEAYRAALKLCRNMIVMPQGGVKNRPGTQVVTETKDSQRVMLLPFIFNQDEAYVIEAGDLYFRFVRDGSGQIFTESFPEVASNDKTVPELQEWLVPGPIGNGRAQRFVTPAVPFTLGAVELRVARALGVPPDGLRVAIWSDSLGSPGAPIIGLGNENFTGPGVGTIPQDDFPDFSRYATDTPIEFPASTTLHLVVHSNNNLWVPGLPYIFVLGTNADFYPGGQCAHFDGLGWVLINGLDLCFRILGTEAALLERSTPYTADEVAALKGRTAQSADVMFIPHHNHPPMELQRYAETNWALTELIQSPGAIAPAPVAVTGDAAGDLNNPLKTWWYVATAVDSATGAESFGSLAVQVLLNISSLQPATVTISPVSGASGYNVYRGRNSGIYGYVGTTNGTVFYDDGQLPDYTICPIQDPSYQPTPDPATPTPAPPTVNADIILTSGYDPQTWWYAISAVGSDESYGSTPVSAFLQLGLVGFVHLTASVAWAAVSGATEYRIFRGVDVNNMGLIGTSNTTTFTDTGTSPNLSAKPLVKAPFAAPGGTPITFDVPGKFPACAAFFDQRLIFAGTDLKPDTIFGSRTGNYRNFGASSPAGDDDAFEFTVAALTFDRIKGLVHSRVLMTFTAASEYVVRGTKDGVLGPSSPDIKAHAHYGSGDLAPLPVGGRVLFVQHEGQAVREFRYDFQQDGYTADDERSVLANHLLEGHTVVDWAYAKDDSAVWIVRDDGVLLGMTYMPQHDLIAWHRHETDGLVESVCCIPEGEGTGVYIAVARQNEGATKRFIERFASRQVTDIKEAVFLDCSLTYRSPAFDGIPLVFADTGSWAADTETICGIDPVNADYFVADHIGSQVVFLDSDGNEYRATVISIISGVIIGVRLERDIPVALQATLSTTGTAWTHALKTFSFPHLTSRTVSALVDGNVIHDLTVDALGVVELPICGSTVTVGIPYTSEIETLDINVDGRSMQTVQKVTGRVWFEVRASRGLWAGEDPTKMREWKQRRVVDGAVNMNDPVPVFTGRDSISISGGFGNSGSVTLQQRDPLPVEILSVTPEVSFGS